MRLHIPISSLAAPRGGNLANDLTTADAHLAPVLPGKGASPGSLCMPACHVCGVTAHILAMRARCLLGQASYAVFS